MKKTSALVLLHLLTGLGFIYGQDVQKTPIRGFYKVLAALSPQPASEHDALDKIKFPLDQSYANKVLSEKPHYLTNVSIDAFSLPAPPANSSAQTRAELNY